MSKLLIKYASRSRPQRMFSIIKGIFNNADNPSNICLLLSLDVDDITVYNKTVLAKLKVYLNKYDVKVFFGKRGTKVDAFNRDIDKIKDWNHLLHVTDFTELLKGFDTMIKDAYKLDLCSASFESINSNGRVKNKMFLIRKSDYVKFGHIYSPKLKGNFEDEELEFRYIANTKFVHYLEPIHRYVHPRWLYLEPDQLLVQNIRSWKQDLEMFELLTLKE